MTRTRRRNYNQGAPFGATVVHTQQQQSHHSEQHLVQLEDELQKLREVVEKQNKLLEKLKETKNEKEMEKLVEVEKQASKVGEKVPEKVPKGKDKDEGKAVQPPEVVQNLAEGVAENVVKIAENATIGGCQQPFTDRIMRVQMPYEFKIVATIEPYNIAEDPLEHIDQFLITSSYFLSAATMIYAQHLTQGLPNPLINLLYLGIVLFVVGIVGNFYHHYLLSKLRGKGEKEYKISKGGLFDLVICPHYLFEIIVFYGISFISQTLYAFSFTIGTTFYLLGRSYATRKWYVSKFEDFPKDVKAIIPFVF